MEEEQMVEITRRYQFELRRLAQARWREPDPAAALEHEVGRRQFGVRRQDSPRVAVVSK